MRCAGAGFTSLGLHINSTNSNLKFRQPTRFRINPQDSSFFSFQDQYSRILKNTQGSRFIQVQISSHITFQEHLNLSRRSVLRFFRWTSSWIVDVSSIELAVGSPLDHLIFLVLRGSWSFVELTRTLDRA
ncbi:hypothetical protein PGT21_017713 [Puccinia graminis f. sp. tritici]|uniref:Uncharacterized protein n=1 Tax=Puccinia graminis f. sp. tritici TaxID=56615 RepID=A0A5B0N8U3_PUCGR|nr:hypothetical protein PGT21_017713 [Puccinia graminis f. sp. tritici]